MLQSERYQWALATVALHVLGSLLMTVVGIRWVEYWQA
jgi:fluoride ion exporter CrcB/FEX